jgi:small subunit ribosomal protein S4
VNGRRVDIASFRVRPGDVITPASKEKTVKMVKDAKELNKSQTVPDWLEVSEAEMSSKVLALPKREHVPHPIQEQLVVEICSK